MRAELADQRLNAFGDAADVGAGSIGMVDLLAPDGLALLEFGAENGALELHAFGKERIAIGKTRDGFERAALIGGKKRHMHELY